MTTTNQKNIPLASDSSQSVRDEAIPPQQNSADDFEQELLQEELERQTIEAQYTSWRETRLGQYGY